VAARHDHTSRDIAGLRSAATTITTTIPGQNAALTFSGTAGQKAAIRGNSLTGLSQTYLSLLKADYSSLGYFNYPSSAYLEAVTLPVTGTYILYQNPVSSETGQVNVTLYVFTDVTGPLTVNAAPIAVTIPTITQQGFFTFTGNAGQTVTVRVTNNVIGFVGIELRKADGTLLSNGASNGSSFNIASATLPAAGTYTVNVDPVALGTGSLSLQVTSP